MPDVELVKQLYSLRFSLDRMRRGKAWSGKLIQGNSTPWIENPRTLEDVKELSARIEGRAKRGLKPVSPGTGAIY
jgi:hypothetical protein